jgi:hypothetical protein
MGARLPVWLTRRRPEADKTSVEFILGVADQSPALKRFHLGILNLFPYEKSELLAIHSSATLACDVLRLASWRHRRCLEVASPDWQRSEVSAEPRQASKTRFRFCKPSRKL